MSVWTRAPRASAVRTACDPVTSATKTLLAYGVIAGPIYLSVSLAQALTRDGFDVSRHAWSLLANGSLGWIQIANLILTGAMTVAAAVGLRRALAGGRGGTWAPRLLAGYGLGTAGAGVFRADPAGGFPPGTPVEATAVSWHGMLHFTLAGIGFGCLVAAAVVLALRFAAEGRRGWAAFSWVAGTGFLVAFVGLAAGGGSPVTVLGFIAAMVLVWAWLSAVSVSLYRGAGRNRS